MYLQRNIEARLDSNYCSGKAKRITYLACVFVALGIQHVMRERHIPSVACLPLLYFSTLSHKRRDFRQNVIEYEICGLIFSTNLSKIFHILRIIRRRVERDMIKNICWSLCKILFIPVTF